MPNPLPFGWGQGIPQQSAADYNAANNRDPNDPNSGAAQSSQSYVELAKGYLQLQGTDVGGEVKSRLEQDPVYQNLEKGGWLRWGEGAGGQGPVLGDTYHKAMQTFMAANPGAQFGTPMATEGYTRQGNTLGGIDPVFGAWTTGGTIQAPKSDAFDMIPGVLQAGAGLAASALMPGMAGAVAGGVRTAGGVSNMFGQGANSDPASSAGYAIQDEPAAYRPSQAFPQNHPAGGDIPQWVIDMMKYKG